MRMLLAIAVLCMACGTTDTIEATESAPVSIANDSIDSTQLHIERTIAALEKSEVLESNIKENITITRTLKHQNDVLKKELKLTQDSIVSLRKELVEVKTKQPKKKNLLQKILNIVPDSVEVITYDSVNVQ